ncbi:hypothetical protein REH65_33220 (plasmid) [Saccharopolyspora sp. ID03-671]|uniref:hypothetical protein n=1 Tax=Saccharopolyspora sp. ID03-671 TaxID=3073066 RepID=UPI0030F43BED
MTSDRKPSPLRSLSEPESDRKHSPLSSNDTPSWAAPFTEQDRVKVQVVASNGDSVRPAYETVAIVHMPQVPRTGEWINLEGVSWRIMRVEWYPPNPDDSLRVLREGGAMLFVRTEPVYDFADTPPEGVEDPWSAENGVLGGRP